MIIAVCGVLMWDLSGGAMMEAFKDMMLCNWASSFCYFERRECLHTEGLAVLFGLLDFANTVTGTDHPEDGGSVFVWNVSIFNHNTLQKSKL